MKAQELLRLLKDDGWYELKGNGGSHRQLKHETKTGKVTVPVHSGKEIPPGTLNSILKQAGLK